MFRFCIKMKKKKQNTRERNKLGFCKVGLNKEKGVCACVYNEWVSNKGWGPNTT